MTRALEPIVILLAGIVIGFVGMVLINAIEVAFHWWRRKRRGK